MTLKIRFDVEIELELLDGAEKEEIRDIILDQLGPFDAMTEDELSVQIRHWNVHER